MSDDETSYELQEKLRAVTQQRDKERAMVARFQDRVRTLNTELSTHQTNELLLRDQLAEAEARAQEREASVRDELRAAQETIQFVKKTSNEDLNSAQEKLLNLQSKMRALQTRVKEAQVLEYQRQAAQQREEASPSPSPEPTGEQFRDTLREELRGQDKKSIIDDLLEQEKQMVRLLEERETVRRFIADSSGTDIEGVSPDRWSPVLKNHSEKVLLEAEVLQLTRDLNSERERNAILSGRCEALERQVRELTKTIETRAKFPASPPPLVDSLSPGLVQCSQNYQPSPQYYQAAPVIHTKAPPSRGPPQSAVYKPAVRKGPGPPVSVQSAWDPGAHALYSPAGTRSPSSVTSQPQSYEIPQVSPSIHNLA